MNIKKQSMFTGVTNEMDLDVTAEQIERWGEGELLPKVFPHLSIVEREFLITGASPEEQANLTSDDILELAEKKLAAFILLAEDDDLSVCCGAPFYEDTDICTSCKEHG